jgi:hypothetical protein
MEIILAMPQFGSAWTAIKAVQKEPPTWRIVQIRMLGERTLAHILRAFLFVVSILILILVSTIWYR